MKLAERLSEKKQDCSLSISVFRMFPDLKIFLFYGAESGLQHFYKSSEGFQPFFRALIHSGILKHLAEYFSDFLL